MRPNTIRTLTAGTAAVALLVGGVTLAAQAADTEGDTQQSVATSSETKTPRGPRMGPMGMHRSMDPEHLAEAIEQIPEAARKDLAEVLLAPESGRAKLIEKMIEAAKDGGYGKDVADQMAMMDKFAKSLENGEFKARINKAFPPELRDELAKVRKLDRQERAAAMQKIAEDARKGVYGEDAKRMFAKRSGGKHNFGHMSGKRGPGHHGMKHSNKTGSNKKD